jgi:beta-glucosidase
MTAYNKINGEYAAGNAALVSGVLKDAWGYRGWVMSDWGSTSSWDFALAGLDQESGAQIDAMMGSGEVFTAPLKAAHSEGRLPKERLSDMVRRILRSIYAVGADSWGPAIDVDLAKHNEIALESARQGIVLLKNDGILPLQAPPAARVAVVGGYAHVGVPTGAGSSAVTPPGGYAAVVPIGGAGFMGAGRALCLLPSSPVGALKKLLPHAEVEFDPGMNPSESAALARRSDVAIVFGIRPEGEGFDNPDLSLPWGQDAVITAVAAANPNTVVVLETGNPVAMPWGEDVRAIVEAWYSGQAGGQAIAEVLAGVVNPSGRLPMTFPVDLSQTPRPELPGLDQPWGTPTTVHYSEGAEVGYRWFAKTGREPLYPFGHGLSYRNFAYSDLEVRGGETITATFVVTNTGRRDGADVPQLYLTQAAGESRTRLLGFERAQLAPGESRRLSITADPRTLARFDARTGGWHLKEGTYRVSLAKAAGDWLMTADITLGERRFGR